MEMLVPALMMAGFAIVYLVFRPDPERGRAIERALLKGARVIDVRSPAAFAARHIFNAESIPLAALPGSLQPNERLIVYGHSEDDSAAAAAGLRAQGFTRVIDAGPMSRWPIPQPG